LEKEAGRCDERRRRGALFIAPREGRTTWILEISRGWIRIRKMFNGGLSYPRSTNFRFYRNNGHEEVSVGFCLKKKKTKSSKKWSPKKNERNYQSTSVKMTSLTDTLIQWVPLEI
jgi:hypothetical protein